MVGFYCEQAQVGLTDRYAGELECARILGVYPAGALTLSAGAR